MTYSERELEFTFAKNHTIVSSLVWTQYRNVTDGQTDGIPLASTALCIASNADARRAVKTLRHFLFYRTSNLQEHAAAPVGSISKAEW